MHNLFVPIGILMLATSLLPLGVLKYVERKTGAKIAIWKSIFCVFLFEFSFAPYAVLVSASRPALGWLNLIYFLLIWMAFYSAHFFLPTRFALVAPIVFGLMLIESASLFISISDDHIYFGFGNDQTIDLSLGGNGLLDFLHALYKIAWAVLPLLGVHYLMKSIEGERTEHGHAN